MLADRLGRIEHEADSRPELPWEVARIPVDGEPVELRWMGEHEEWIAWAMMNGLILTLHARRLPLGQVELVRITDVGPYIEGSRQLRASARLFPGT